MEMKSHVTYSEFEKLKDNYYNFVINQTDFQSEIKQSMIHMKEIQHSISDSITRLMIEVDRFSNLNSEKKGMIKGIKFVTGALFGFIGCIVAFILSPAFDHAVQILHKISYTT
jgi:hypothetical protein